MLKRLLLAFMLLLPTAAVAQTTTVSATVTDVNGNSYANGTVSAQTIGAVGQPIQSTSPASLNTHGTFSITLTSGLSWIFTVCANPTNIGPLGNPTPKQICFKSGVIAVSGASMNISSQLNALAPLLGPAVATGSAVKPFTADAVQFITAEGSDSNDGLSWGSAMLDTSGACAALPSGNSSCSAGTGSVSVSPVYAGGIPSTVSPGVSISAPVSYVINAALFGASPSASAATNQTAFNAAWQTALTSGRPLYIPPGVYSTACPVNFTTGAAGPAGPYVYGDGTNASNVATIRLQCSSNTMAGIDLSGSYGYHIHGLTIQGGTSSGNAPQEMLLQTRISGATARPCACVIDETTLTSQYSPYGIYNYGGEQLTIRDSHIEVDATSAKAIVWSVVNSASVTSTLQTTTTGTTSETGLDIDGNSNGIGVSASGSVIYFDLGGAETAGISIPALYVHNNTNTVANIFATASTDTGTITSLTAMNIHADTCFSLASLGNGLTHTVSMQGSFITIRNYIACTAPTNDFSANGYFDGYLNIWEDGNPTTNPINVPGSSAQSILIANGNISTSQPSLILQGSTNAANQYTALSLNNGNGFHNVLQVGSNVLTAGRTTTFPDATGTAALAAISNCGTSASCASPTTVTSPLIFTVGHVAMSASTTVTVSPLPNTYTAATTFTCTANDPTHATYTWQVTNNNATSITITSGTSNSDTWTYSCMGY